MTRRSRTLAIAVLTLTLAWAHEARAATLIVLPRPGQVGIGLQGEYGSLLQAGNLGNQFSSGGGYAVRIRYRMRYERAIGLSFEQQNFDARAGAQFVDTGTGQVLADTSSLNPKRVTLTVTAAELYQMFGTRGRTTRMLSVGVGLAQIRETLRDAEIQIPPGGDGLFLSAGAGLEHFFFRSLAYDLSVRYHSIFQNGKANHDLQASLGFIFYASY